MKDFNGDKTTPKMLAQQVLLDAISVKLEFFDESGELSHLSESDKERVYNQALKLSKRIAKLLQFDPNSFAG